MSYTTPPTFSDGNALPASDLNILGDDIVDLDARASSVSFSGTRRGTSGAQSIPDSTWTDIIWTGGFDQGTWDTSTTVFTVPAGTVPSGFTSVVIDGRVFCNFATNGTGRRKLRIIKNGAAWTYEENAGGDASETVTLHVADLGTAADGDLLRAQVWQSSGGALDMNNATITIARYGLIV